MRVLYGWILFFVAIGSIMAGGLFFSFMLGIACYLAGREYITIARAKGIRPSARVVLGMIIAFCCCCFARYSRSKSFLEFFS